MVDVLDALSHHDLGRDPTEADIQLLQLLLVLLFGSKFRSKPFTPWLWGSNQIEHMLGEWRSFEAGNTTWTLLSVLNICKRWLFQTALFASADIELPNSKRGYSRTRFRAEDSKQYVQSDYPTAEEMIQIRHRVVQFVQKVLAALGMAEVLRDAGMWDEPPHESWEHVEAAIDSAAEQSAAGADEMQFEGQVLQQQAADAAADAAEVAGEAEEAQEEAAAAGAAAGAAAAEAATARRPRPRRRAVRTRWERSRCTPTRAAKSGSRAAG